MHYPKTLLFLIPLLAFLSSCQKEYPPVPYDISMIYAENLDNSQQEIAAAQDSVYKLAYVMRVTYDAAIVAGHENEYDKYESSATKSDPFTSFAITCTEDFDAAHPAGTPLNDLFNNGMTSANGITYTKMSNLMYYPSRPVDLWLMSPPDLDGNYQFNIEIAFASGKVLTVATSPIFFHS